MRTHLTSTCACVLLLSQVCHADFFPAVPMLRAMAPSGELIVRIKQSPAGANSAVSLYRYNPEEDRYVRESGFELNGSLPHQLFVSDSGDIVLASYGEVGAIRLYSKEGELHETWDLQDFLSKSEVKACAETATSVQWFDDGEFVARKFYFHGPSSTIRGMPASFTVRRGANLRISFSGVIDAETGELTKNSIKPARR